VASLREQGWALFDAIVSEAPLRDANPWQRTEGGIEYAPDYATLEHLLGVPVALKATSQSGIPALALDVWVSYEFRRAGFHPDRVWPRPRAPRVLAVEVSEFVDRLPKALQSSLRTLIDQGVGGSGSANLLGKNYVKQVDVVMSSWATGPELLVSTKRMDSSFGKNAANRVEESYGDAKNLRLRHPQAALGFVYALSAVALEREAEIAAWLIDLLGKLGREDDAYHAVALVLPDLSPQTEPTGPPEEAAAGPLKAGAAEDGVPEAVDERESALEYRLQDQLIDATTPTPPTISLRRSAVPPDLDPGRFFWIMCDRVLDNAPINFHVEARRRRGNPSSSP